MSGVARAGVNLNELVYSEGEMFQSVMEENTMSAQEKDLIANNHVTPESLKKLL